MTKYMQLLSLCSSKEQLMVECKKIMTPSEVGLMVELHKDFTFKTGNRLIVAKFTGLDGSLRYRKGKTYTLLHTIEPATGLLELGKVHIEDINFKTFDESTGEPCVYSTIIKFLEKWEVKLIALI